MNDPTLPAALLGLIPFALVMPGALLIRLVYSRSRCRARQLQTPRQEDFFRRLLRAVPEGHVFPQVAVKALIDADGASLGARLQAWRVARERVDWVVCDEHLRVVCVVELDDLAHCRESLETHKPQQQHERHDRCKARHQLLSAAGIQCLRWQPSSGQGTHALRTQIEEMRRQRPSALGFSLS